jgi:hypothetical protein
MPSEIWNNKREKTEQEQIKLIIISDDNHSLILF